MFLLFRIDRIGIDTVETRAQTWVCACVFVQLFARKIISCELLFTLNCQNNRLFCAAPLLRAVTNGKQGIIKLAL
jgi:hypothetical protein